MTLNIKLVAPGEYRAESTTTLDGSEIQVEVSISSFTYPDYPDRCKEEAWSFEVSHLYSDKSDASRVFYKGIYGYTTPEKAQVAAQDALERGFITSEWGVFRAGNRYL